MIKGILTKTKKVIVLDIFFISYDEEEKTENFKLLKSRFPSAQQIDGVEGIHNAYFEAFKKSSSTHFYTMDADNRLLENFSFELPSTWTLEDRRLHVWRCRNVVNNLVYGYGGIKLWPKALFESGWSESYLDFTTTMAKFGYAPVSTIASETHFNSSAFSSWRSGFRECAKLSSSSIVNESSDTSKRLMIWNTEGLESKNGEWAVLGARMGTLFALKNSKEKEMNLINDFEALSDLFKEVSNFEVKSLLEEKKGELKQLGYLINE
jgi:hypothetical protein